MEPEPDFTPGDSQAVNVLMADVGDTLAGSGFLGSALTHY